MVLLKLTEEIHTEVVLCCTHMSSAEIMYVETGRERLKKSKSATAVSDRKAVISLCTWTLGASVVGRA